MKEMQRPPQDCYCKTVKTTPTNPPSNMSGPILAISKSTSAPPEGT